MQVTSIVCRRTGMKVDCANADRTTFWTARGSTPDARATGHGLRPSILVAPIFAANAGGTTAFHARGRGFESRRSKDRSSVARARLFRHFLSLLFLFLK